MKKMTVVLLLLFAGVAIAKKHEDAGPCTKNISFSAVMKSDGQVHPYMVDWIDKWIRKNAKKHPDVCFSQQPQAGLTNYVVIISSTPTSVRGVQIVKTTSTNSTPVSGSGTVSGNNGETWDYTYHETVTTTTTSSEAVPYEIQENTLYATAYDANGGIVGQRNHLYATQRGGDDASEIGTNMGSLINAINARGRLLNGVVTDIERAH